MTQQILIVDDSAVTRSLIKRSLQISGFATNPPLEAANGAAALALLGTHKVQLVLADLHMPEMGGAELIQRMQQNPATARIPVVIVSAEPSVSRIDELCRLGAKGYLRKPFTPESLKNLLAPMLESADVPA